MDFKTKGEEAFAKLLTERGLLFVYEQRYLNKIKIPDFTLTFTEPNIISEIRDVDLNDEDKKILTDLSGVGTASWFQDKPYTRIRRMIHEKADQLKEYKSYPSLVVLYKNPHNLTVDLSTENIFESMHADMSIIFETNDFGHSRAKTSFNARNAVVGPNRNTHVSAVAVLEKYRPYAELANDIVRKYKEMGGNALTEEGQIDIAKLFDEKSTQGINFELEVLRLRIIHNPSAKISLALGILFSPYDIEVFYDHEDKKFKKYQNNVIQEYP